MTRGDIEHIPPYLYSVLTEFAGAEGIDGITRWLRDADECMTPEALSAYKASRVSFVRILARRMIEERWRVERQFFECDAECDGRARYLVTIGNHRLTYIVRFFRWDGQEKIGRRSDGVNRDMFAALFHGVPDDARIEREFAMMETRDLKSMPEGSIFGLADVDRMRTDADIIGWNPANRSARFFEAVIEALAAGHQPDPALIGSGSGYLLRNAGFLGSGRNGTRSYGGFEADHPLRHPYFADLFGLYLLRQVSIDLVNGVAAARNPQAARLHPDIARYVGVGNSSGQGMCVALQRWPHWVASWVAVREYSIAYAKSQPVVGGGSRARKVTALLERAAGYLRSIQLQSEDFVIPNQIIASNLDRIRQRIEKELRSGAKNHQLWGDLCAELASELDAETFEQFHSLLIETYWEFADAAAGYLQEGMALQRAVQPEMTAAALLDVVRENYGWALQHDLRLSRARRHFWYHSAEGGEQRRGDRGVDPNEEFESFIDHIGAIQRLTAVLTACAPETVVAEVVANDPSLAFEVSRAQYLAGLPYAEIRGNLVHEDFIPAHLIRFFVAVLGMECAAPLSIRYVRGVFIQGMPLPHELEAGADPDWIFAMEPKLKELEAMEP